MSVPRCIPFSYNRDELTDHIINWVNQQYTKGTEFEAWIPGGSIRGQYLETGWTGNHEPIVRYSGGVVGLYCFYSYNMKKPIGCNVNDTIDLDRFGKPTAEEWLASGMEDNNYDTAQLIYDTKLKRIGKLLTIVFKSEVASRVWLEAGIAVNNMFERMKQESVINIPTWRIIEEEINRHGFDYSMLWDLLDTVRKVA